VRLWRRARPVLCRGCATPTDGEHGAALLDPAAAAVIERARDVIERFRAHHEPLSLLLVAFDDLDVALHRLDHPSADGAYRPLDEPVPDGAS